MKKEKKLINKIFLSIIIILFMTLNNCVFADVGSFESYDSGSDWSSGSSYIISSDSLSASSGWFSGGSSPSSSWSGSSSKWSSDDDTSRWSYSSNTKNNSNSNDNSITVGTVLFSIIILSIFVVVPIMKEISAFYKPAPYDALENDLIIDPPIYDGLTEERIKVVDKLFNKEEFNQTAKMLFVKMQNAWTNRNWDEIRPFETDELFIQHKTQIDGYIRNNTINIIDRICVLYSKLFMFKQTGDKEILTVVIKAKMADYVIDATTKKILKGNKNIEKIKFYQLEFIRKAGVKTKSENEGISTTNCPNCGAPNKITASGQCEYCKSTITNGDFGWVLNNLEPFKF